MNEYESFFSSESTSSTAPTVPESLITKPNTSDTAYGTAFAPEDEEKVPGYLREDASRWDQYSDGQRKLIVFGILIAVTLLLTLLFNIVPGCGSCELCAGISGSDASDRTVSGSSLPEEDDSFSGITIPALVSDADLPEDDTPAIEDDSGNQQPVEDTVQPTVPDSAVDSDDDSSAGKSSGFFSSCRHEADNEAGSGTASSNYGLFSFLFGCSDSCSVSCAESLTDPVHSDEDDYYDRLINNALSGGDVSTEIWPTQPDDQAYLAMMNEQWAALSNCMIQLSELDSALSQYTDPERVSENDSFRALSSQLLTWCDGAEQYNTAALTGQQAINCSMISVRLAGNVRTYIESYPLLITGSTSGTDIADKVSQMNTIMGDMVELYAAINTALPADTQPTE